MDWPRLPRLARLLLPTGLALATMAMAGCAGATPGQTSGDLGSLQQTVTAQGTRIAAVEQQVTGLQTAVAQARITPTPTARPATPTVVPAVTGIASDGAIKGNADAKVTITEYSDYL